MEQEVNKTINIDLFGIDWYDPQFVMSVFIRQAKREQWTDQEIASIIDESISKDHKHFVSIIKKYCEIKPLEKKVDKTVRISLERISPDPEHLITCFRNNASQQGWSTEEIEIVVEEAESQNYNHLINTLMLYVKP